MSAVDWLGSLAADEQGDRMALVMQSPPRIKRVLSEEFRPVIVDANSVGQDLQRFSSRFGGDVNDILALNEHVLQLLEKMAHKVRPRIGDGFIQRVFNGRF